MSTKPEENDGTESTDRFDQSVYNIDIGEDIGDYENTSCDPMEHAGRPAKVVVMGPYNEDVRVITMCSECGQVEEGGYHDDAQGVTIEGHGTTLQRLTNYPEEATLVKTDYDEPLDQAAAQRGHDDYEVLHAGSNGEELMYLITDASKNNMEEGR